MNLRVPFGFRFENPDLASIMGLLQAHHGEIQERAYVATRDFLAGRCANEIDKAVLKGRPVGRPYDEASSVFLARQARVEREGFADPQVDFSFSVTILPHDKAAYGLVVSQQRRWVEDFLKLPGIAPYAYWSGEDSDRPIEIAPEEWRARGDLWETLVRKDPAFRIASSGIVHDFPRLLDFPSAEEVAGALPSFGARLRRYATEAVIERRLAQLQSEGVGLSAAMVRSLEWPASEEGHVAVLKAREGLRPRLRETLTLDDVLGPETHAASIPA